MNLRVKEICKEKGITIQELADNMEMKRESLSRAINGNPTLETLEKIATALGVNISELFDQPKNNTTGIACPHCGKNINIKVESIG
ncbi:helix-turn-helix transcriptional regulator [Bacteroides ovatus]|uniref:Helix-turn-helix transcriptional regulator n=1 Tax=Bacteroides ovatus TaxID=28116 RepID=A0A7J4XR64_BACOV|nr:helix-turn-helix transcriptional regulator [Bacteroides ovatus]KAA4633948.1 helix-turn-helix transcriptional regulator [Bacteroides ovatus]KAA4668523.1 helix-turn-helix transcriptional regulator [Bacteroides ovatus]KAA4677745.1 helix-turn-helix transcriptional regulator [Bacteroides ovatus]NAA10654.1 helix-turn-helix domain-containing protein [Escherichia coli]